MFPMIGKLKPVSKRPFASWREDVSVCFTLIMWRDDACLCICSNGLKAMTMFKCVCMWKFRRHILFDRYVHDVHILSEIYIPYVAYVADAQNFRCFFVCSSFVECFFRKFVEAPLGEFQGFLAPQLGGLHDTSLSYWFSAYLSFQGRNCS